MYSGIKREKMNLKRVSEDMGQGGRNISIMASSQPQFISCTKDYGKDIRSQCQEIRRELLYPDQDRLDISIESRGF
jgi:hypothetical protein